MCKTKFHYPFHCVRETRDGKRGSRLLCGKDDASLAKKPKYPPPVTRGADATRIFSRFRERFRRKRRREFSHIKLKRDREGEGGRKCRARNHNKDFRPLLWDSVLGLTKGLESFAMRKSEKDELSSAIWDVGRARRIRED